MINYCGKKKKKPIMVVEKVLSKLTRVYNENLLAYESVQRDEELN